MKTTLTKALYAIVILALFTTTSCKKDGGSGSSGYYVKFKLDGTQKQYSETTAAVFTSSLPMYSCAMVGEKQISGITYEGMSITLFNDAAITTNVTYTDKIVESIGAPQATFLFTDDKGAQSSSALLANPNVQVTITQMDDNSVTGTFSGTIQNTTDFTTTQSVTEGQFHLPKH